MKNYLQVDADTIYRRVNDVQPVTKFYWSRVPGDDINEKTGEAVPVDMGFRGTVREWYEGLTETIYRAFAEMTANLHGDGMTRGIVVSRDVAVILECALNYRPDMSSPEILSREGFAMIGFLRGVPVYVINTVERATCHLFVLGCDLCDSVTVVHVSIANMNV